MNSRGTAGSIGGALDHRQRMLMTVAIDADRGDEHQILVDMKPVDLDDEQVELRQVGAHEGVQLLGRQRYEPARRRRFRYAAARARRHVALRQPHRPPKPSGGDVDQHQIHRPAAEPVLRCRAVPARDGHLPATDASNAGAFDLHFAAVETNPPARPAPPMGMAFLVSTVARAAGGFNVGLHHRPQRFHTGRKTQPLEALLNVRERFLYSLADRTRR